MSDVGRLAVLGLGSCVLILGYVIMIVDLDKGGGSNQGGTVANARRPALKCSPGLVYVVLKVNDGGD